MAEKDEHSLEEHYKWFDERKAKAVQAFKEKTGLKEGARVQYIGVTVAQLEYWGNRYTDPRDVLEFDTIYEIEEIEIGSSYSIVKLVEFPGKEFSGVIFKAIDK